MEMASRLAFKTPVLGWMIQDAINGRPDAKYYFGVNVLLLVALLTYFFGFPFLITVADIMAVLGLVFIIYMSAADSFSAAGRKYARESKLRARAI
jgi:hypothetical protein